MEFSAEQIADLINGQVVGNKNITVSGLSKIEEGQPNTLTFLANQKYEPFIYTTHASIAIVAKSFTPTKATPSTLTLIKVDDPYSCFAKLLEVYNKMFEKPSKIEKGAFIAETAQIGKDVYIGANAYISDGAVIGDYTKIYPNVSIYHNCEVGSHCILHAGAVVGADGFGFAPDEKGEFQKVPQIGNVILEDNVEIGANSTIDRATLGSTILRKGVKIDNLVQIAHNVEIGENSAMAAQAGIAGSTKVGKNVLVGGQAGISGHIKIADRTQIVAQSGIPSSVKKTDTTLMGSPGIPIDDFKRSHVGFRRLPIILNRLQAIEDKLK